jgi:hypothetical protein
LIGNRGIQHRACSAETDPSRQRVEFVSHTGPGKDGILFKIVVPAPDDSTLRRLGGQGDGLTEDDLFTFTSGPLTISFPLTGRLVVTAMGWP